MHSEPLHVRAARALSAVALLVGVSGCEAIRLTTVDSSESVVSQRHAVVASTKSVRARVEIDGSHLAVDALQGCDLVEMEVVRRVEVREGDDEPIEELTVMGIASLPLTTGVVLLVDSAKVHDNDRNQRLYNPVGEKGAIIGGAVLTALGGLMVLAPTIHMIRVAAAGEEEESTLERQGRTLESNVRCEGSERPIRTSVQIVVGGAPVWGSSTGPDGRLEIDLATVIPRALAEQHDVATVLVAGQDAARIEMAMIRAGQRDQEVVREEQVWRSIDVERCRAQPRDDKACGPLEAFVRMFPDGRHADEAQRVLESAGRGTGAVIAEAPETDPATRDAIARAAAERAQAAREACHKSCRAGCAGKEACVDRCMRDACTEGLPGETSAPPRKGGPR